MPHQSEKSSSNEGDQLFSVRQLADEVPALTEGGIRWDLFNRQINGLEYSGAIVKHGRRILIWRNRYLSWISGMDCS